MAESTYASLEDWAFRRHLMLALVFTDIVGSTSLRKEMGDEAMEGVIQRHFAKARQCLTQHDGFEIKTIGDEVMAVFPTAIDALNYVIDLRDDTGDQRIQIRAAIHVGTVTIVDNDPRGTMVHLAARISKLPRGAAIYVTDDAQIQIKQVKSHRHAQLTWLRKKVQVKDFPDVGHVWVVLTPKMREENRRNLAALAPKPVPSITVPPSPSTVSRRPVRLPPPPGAELRNERPGSLSSLLSKPRAEPQPPQPDWWKTVIGKSDSPSGGSSILAALLGSDPGKGNKS